MKDTGKTINGVKLYSDPDCPPNMLYLMPEPHFVPRPVGSKGKALAKDLGEALARRHDKFRPLQPRRSGTLTEVKDED